MQRNIRQIKRELTNLRGVTNFASPKSRKHDEFCEEAFRQAVYEACFPQSVYYLNEEDVVAMANKKIKALVKGGYVDVNVLGGGCSGSPIYQILTFGNNSSLLGSTIQLLIDVGAKITTNDIAFAILGGKLWAVKILVENGVDVNGIAIKGSIRHPRGIRPLALAIEEGHNRIANYLREQGAKE